MSDEDNLSDEDDPPWCAILLDTPGERTPKERARQWIRHRANAIHRESVRAWAGRDNGDFPRREDAVREARDELTVLCSGLAGWGAVPPDEVFLRRPYTGPARIY